MSPSIETLEKLLFVLGEDLVVRAEPRDFGVDRTLNRSNLRLSPDQRVTRSLEFADFINELQGGAKAPDSLESE